MHCTVVPAEAWHDPPATLSCTLPVARELTSCSAKALANAGLHLHAQLANARKRQRVQPVNCRQLPALVPFEHLLQAPAMHCTRCHSLRITCQAAEMPSIRAERCISSLLVLLLPVLHMPCAHMCHRLAGLGLSMASRSGSDVMPPSLTNYCPAHACMPLLLSTFCSAVTPRTSGPPARRNRQPAACRMQHRGRPHVPRASFSGAHAELLCLQSVANAPTRTQARRAQPPAACPAWRWGRPRRPRGPATGARAAAPS